jgi:hypothetical protein
MIVAWHLGVQDGLWIFLYSSVVVNEHLEVSLLPKSRWME